LEKLFLEDILMPESLNKRDFRNIKLNKFDWIKSGSFKEIHELTALY
jgi:hypothetical protein